jgi:hypothetical protein
MARLAVHTTDLFDDTLPVKVRQRRKHSNSERLPVARALNEVIAGRRPALRLYSKKLGQHLWFVNEGLVNPSESRFDGKVITMAMLAQMMTTGSNLLEAAEQA